MQISRNPKIKIVVIGIIAIYIITYLWSQIPRTINNIQTTCGYIKRTGWLAKTYGGTFTYRVNGRKYEKNTSLNVSVKTGDSVLVGYDQLNPNTSSVLEKRDLAANHVTDTCNCLKKVKKTEWYIDDYTK